MRTPISVSHLLSTGYCLTQLQVDNRYPTGDHAWLYEYDANGNRSRRTASVPGRQAAWATDYQYDDNDRLVYAQDYRVRMLTGGQREPQRAIGAADRSTSRETYLGYDGLGRRLEKQYVDRGGRGRVEQFEYSFDGLDPVTEHQPQRGNAREEYYRSSGQQLVGMQRTSAGGGLNYWYHNDGRQNVAALSDAGGAVKDAYRYDPYGEMLPVWENAAHPQNHLHNDLTLTGKAYDERLGMTEFGFRLYDGETGGWLNQDPLRGWLTAPQTLHRYQFVLNDPINWIDLYGFQAQCNCNPVSGSLNLSNHQINSSPAPQSQQSSTAPQSNRIYIPMFGTNQPPQQAPHYVYIPMFGTSEQTSPTSFNSYLPFIANQQRPTTLQVTNGSIPFVLNPQWQTQLMDSGTMQLPLGSTLSCSPFIGPSWWRNDPLRGAPGHINNAYGLYDISKSAVRAGTMYGGSFRLMQAANPSYPGQVLVYGTRGAKVAAGLGATASHLGAANPFIYEFTPLGAFIGVAKGSTIGVIVTIGANVYDYGFGSNSNIGVNSAEFLAAQTTDLGSGVLFPAMCAAAGCFLGGPVGCIAGAVACSAAATIYQNENYIESTSGLTMPNVVSRDNHIQLLADGYRTIGNQMAGNSNSSTHIAANLATNNINCVSSPP